MIIVMTMMMTMMSMMLIRIMIVMMMLMFMFTVMAMNSKRSQYPFALLWKVPRSHWPKCQWIIALA